MQFQRLSLDDSAHATGTVVVIDVLRAFTSACYALGAGASEILLVSEVKEAFALRDRFPGALLMGEVGGGPIEGFNFSNSPAHYANLDLSGTRLIQRTSNGTQGVTRATQADHTLAASFACAGATARHIQQLAPALVTFVITGWHADSTDPNMATKTPPAPITWKRCYPKSIPIQNLTSPASLIHPQANSSKPTPTPNTPLPIYLTAPLSTASLLPCPSRVKPMVYF